MSAAELQEEEREVLSSIYDGDEMFKQISDTVFQYKIGEDGDYKSLLLEISWGANYPEEMPTINMDSFYNKNIFPEVKSSIVEKLKEQGEPFLGCAMTYTLFEWAKENHQDLMANQTEQIIEQSAGDATQKESAQPEQSKKVKEKKEQLTKSQKRRIVNRIDLKTGERPRGWDWVDVIKHLSQTGSTNPT